MAAHAAGPLVSVRNVSHAYGKSQGAHLLVLSAAWQLFDATVSTFAERYLTAERASWLRRIANRLSNMTTRIKLVHRSQPDTAPP